MTLCFFSLIFNQLTKYTSCHMFRLPGKVFLAQSISLSGYMNIFFTFFGISLCSVWFNDSCSHMRGGWDGGDRMHMRGGWDGGDRIHMRGGWDGGGDGMEEGMGWRR